ncbi:MAG: hypothetical protein COT81_03010 [Candidatus Buchananbacteria bacterium CG10_big_fil_rev_8_21_14_0_10_42_9]|uniref:Rhodanese domain-containing protein n=1 Tax=Candidatus Buchananbacteria bacterium CG10_big_fil_rev_8_21_14_0_10_42_9 TaxID=1974526 RepID=A0A2H0W176_9BACT|nr:MAG: hypothetical protein COT81_03010 [Candidatus Buchananbacteria bacterium CG10_big_fil_rev_8_21_14_0_10_42_9]
MAKTISTEELKAKIDGGAQDFHLVDVLSANSYEARHVPSAKNVPMGDDFIERFEKEITDDKNAEVIVYCSSSTCQASVNAAATLEDAGYTNVSHYQDGLAGWQDAGLEFAEGSK